MFSSTVDCTHEGCHYLICHRELKALEGSLLAISQFNITYTLLKDIIKLNTALTNYDRWPGDAPNRKGQHKPRAVHVWWHQLWWHVMQFICPTALYTSVGLFSPGSMRSFAGHISLFITTLKLKVLNPINVSALKLLALISQNLTVNEAFKDQLQIFFVLFCSSEDQI